ncbi:hypothetical protein ACQKM9_16580 [Viridibacillus sp. NPDC093762]|uniref:hypothetical protein n=1 Tax=Viridibacillus sp. NPDC093762 TaxID=3390720 RepID=UPI003D084E36
MSKNIVKELTEAIDRIKHDPHVCAVILTGNIKEFPEEANKAPVSRAYMESLVLLLTALAQLEKSTIAAVTLLSVIH